MGSSVLPHALGAVCDEPAIRHPAGQGEVQVHPDVIVESLVIGGGIRTKRAVPITHFTRHRTTLPHYLPMFLNLLGRRQCSRCHRALYSNHVCNRSHRHL